MLLCSIGGGKIRDTSLNGATARTGGENKLAAKNFSDGNHGNPRKSHFLFCLPRQKTLGAEGSEDPLSQSLSLSRHLIKELPPPSDSLPGALSSFSFVEGALLHTKASIISIDNKGMCVTFVQLLLSFPLCALAPLKNDKIFQAVNRLEKEKTPEATRCCATDHRESLPEVVTNTARLAYTLRAKKPKSNLLPVLMVAR